MKGHRPVVGGRTVVEHHAEQGREEREIRGNHNGRDAPRARGQVAAEMLSDRTVHAQNTNSARMPSQSTSRKCQNSAVAPTQLRPRVPSSYFSARNST